jgi:hypothetical protein
MRIRFLIILFVVVGLIVGLRYGTTSSRQIYQQPTSDFRTIKGRVVDNTNLPVRGALIFAECPKYLLGLLPSTYADEQGKFAVKVFGPGTYKIYAAKEEDDYPRTDSAFHYSIPIVPPEVVIDDQALPSEAVVRIGPKAQRLTGIVVDAITKRQIDNARIILRHMDRPEYEYETEASKPGKKGFSILVPPVPLIIEVKAPNHETWRSTDNRSDGSTGTLSTTAGDKKELNVSLRPIK